MKTADGSNEGALADRQSRAGRRRTAVFVTSFPDQPSVTELERLAAADARPRKDYIALARALDAEIVDTEYTARRAGRLARVLASRGRDGISLGQIAEGFFRRRHYDVIVAWSDRIGLPLAFLYRLVRSRPRLVLIGMLVSDPEKAVFLKRLRAHSRLDALIFHDRMQTEICEDRLGVPRSKLHVAKHGIDERFWRPQPIATENLICSVGWEQRDYETLLLAVDGLAVELHLAIGSVGSVGAKEAAARLQQRGVPTNVRFVWPSTDGLRELYARSQFVVIPIRDVPYEAGSTTLLEAMAMEKAVILSRARGGTDILRDREHGLYVPPGDPVALREAIQFLLANTDEARRMGRAGRTVLEERYTLDAYVRQLVRIIEDGAGRAAV